jgi:hypothetical protein
MVKNMALNHVVLSNPDDNFNPYDATRPLPAKMSAEDSSGNTLDLRCDASGHLLTSSSGGGSGGDASSANQLTMISKLEDISSNQLAVEYNNNQAVGASDKGFLVFGKDSSNQAHPIHITNNGDVEVEIADFVKGQDTAANSFPVVLASDQSVLDVSVLHVPLASGAATSALQTLGNTIGSSGNALLTSIDDKMSNGNEGSLSTVQQVGMYAYNLNATSFVPMEIENTGELRVKESGTVTVQGNSTVGGTDSVNGSYVLAFDASNNATHPIQMDGQKSILVALNSVTNHGSFGNLSNNNTLIPAAFGPVTSDVWHMNFGQIFYEDSATSSTDQVKILGSPDNINWFEMTELYPSNNAANTKREASQTYVNIQGIKYMKIENSSSTDTYNDVYCSVVGSA